MTLTKKPITMIIGSICLFILLAVIVKSIPKAFFLALKIRKGLINPSPAHLVALNEIITDCKKRWFFLRIFHFALFRQARKYLKKSNQNKKFINCVNTMIENISKYAIDEKKKKKRLGSILEKYDRKLAKSLKSYESHKAQPLIKFFRFLKGMGNINLPFTLYAGQDTLITVVGEPLVNPNLINYKTDRSVFLEINQFFGPKKDFIEHLYSIAA